eukprot:514067_1
MTTQPLTVKLVLLGDSRVGKSSVVISFVKNEFDQYKFPTICATFLTKSVSVGDYLVKFEIWDTAGQEKYRSLSPLYYRGASAALVVYDITNRESFENARKWIEEVHIQEGKHVVIGLAGNKVDLVNRKVSIDEAKQVAKLYMSHSYGLTEDQISLMVSGYIHQQSNFFIPLDLIQIVVGLYDGPTKCIFFETSAKTSVNIQEIFRRIAQKIANEQQHRKKAEILLEPKPCQQKDNYYKYCLLLVFLLSIIVLICSYFFCAGEEKSEKK